MIRYSKEHEWVRVDGDSATVGISEHAVSELGDITFVELPEVGNTVSKDDSVAFIESVKAASDVYTPISGEITEVNERLEDEPEIINASPLDEGWIYKMKVSDSSELDTLMDEEAYKAYIASL